MEFILVKNNIVVNRIKCVGMDYAVSVFQNYEVYDDSERNYNIGDTYTG